MKAKFAPLLAAKLDFSKLKYPVLVSPKLDGIRALVRDMKLVSRTLKPIPNKFIRKYIEHRSLDGLDGELIIGSHLGEGVFARSSSGVMSRDGEPAFTYWVFDSTTEPHKRYVERLEAVRYLARQFHDPIRVKAVQQEYIHNEEFLRKALQDLVGQGAEGAIVRNPDAPYKFGRSTAAEGILLKLVNYETEEAVIIDFTELQRNENPTQLDNLGHTKRSSHKANKRAGGTLGAFRVESENYRDTFEVGTGFTAEQRDLFWKTRKGLKGKIIRFKHKPFGAVDKPRHPVFQGFRDKRDI